tara:strand:- start:258 stop:710 length:453 start_codon:yes stop_codon:yes gene_type:complete
MAKKIIIDTIYLKESNIEIPNQVEIFGKEIPEVKCDLSCQSNFQKIFFDEKETYEVNLSFQIASIAKVDQSNNLHLYTLNFIQSGLFRLEGYKKEDEALETLAVDIPNILFPYARLHAELITKSTGLHPVLMQEIDFKEIYYKEIGKKYK